MEDEDYAIVPAKKMQDLQEQLNELKRNPLGGTTAGADMTSSMNKLSRTMDEMLSLFKDAASQMQTEEKEMGSHRKIEPIVEKLDILIDQNQKLAKGILAIADMLKEMKHRHPMMPRPSFAPMQPRQEDIFGNLPPSMPSITVPPPSFPPPIMTGGPPRTLPPAPNPPSFMKRREAQF